MLLHLAVLILTCKFAIGFHVQCAISTKGRLNSIYRIGMYEPNFEWRPLQVKNPRTVLRKSVTCDWIPSKRDNKKEIPKRGQGKGGDGPKRGQGKGGDGVGSKSSSPGAKDVQQFSKEKYSRRQKQWRGEAPFPKLLRKISSAQPGFHSYFQTLKELARL